VEEVLISAAARPALSVGPPALDATLHAEEHRAEPEARQDQPGQDVGEV
jgi:hypothetical protein